MTPFAVAPIMMLCIAGIGGSGPDSGASQQAITPVCAIQSGDVPAGSFVVTEGIVTGVFTATLGGLFIQSPQCDDDPLTSDGIFVYAGNKAVAAAEGDRVRVSGTVREFEGLTELAIDRAQDVEIVGRDDLPAPVAVELPAGRGRMAGYLESFEGMRVALPAMRVVGATTEAGDAWLVPSSSGVVRVFAGPDEGWLVGLTFGRDRLMLTHGDEVRGLVGPLYYSFEHFWLAMRSAGSPEWAGATVVRGGLQPATAEPAAPGEISVATYNLRDLFDAVNDPGTNDPVVSADEYRRQVSLRAASIATDLAMPDVVAVQEVEHERVLRDVATDPVLAGARYDDVLLEGPDGRGIDVGLLYRSARLRLRGRPTQEQACTPLDVPDPGVDCVLPGGAVGKLLFGRPPLVVRLEVVATGARLTFVVNHLKSKSGESSSPATAALNARIRLEQARHVGAVVRALKASEPGTPVLVLGDFNDTPESEPLRALCDGGALRDPHATVAADSDYTYVFGGVSQVIDYILVDAGTGVSSFSPVHSNADFPAAAPAGVVAAPQPSHTRVSDHDAALLRLPPPTPAWLSVYLPIARLDPRPLPTASPTSPTGSPGRTPGVTPTRPAASGTPTATPPAGRSPAPTSAPTASATPSATPGGPPRTPLRIQELFYDGTEPATEGDEYIAFRNVSATAVALTGWQIVSVRGDQRYRFPDGVAMQPGQVCRVYTDEVHPEHCGLSWGSAQAIWRNDGDKAEIRDPGGRLVDWYCYGDMADDCR